MRAGKAWYRLGGVALLITFASPHLIAQVTTDAQSQPSPPVEIEADTGIEWQRHVKVVVARGNARAVRGDIHVRADELRARYRDRPDGSTQIWRLEGDGNVQISSPTETAYGEAATYDFDQNLLVLKGGERVRLVTDSDEISAERQLEYSPQTNTLIARGNALAVQSDRRLQAEQLTAHLVRDASGKSRVQNVEAVDRVKVITPQDVFAADRGTYNAETGIATLTGSVKIVRGANQLNGCRGEVDLKSGVSRLFACGRGDSGTAPVRGIIRPNDKTKD